MTIDEFIKQAVDATEIICSVNLQITMFLEKGFTEEDLVVYISPTDIMKLQECCTNVQLNRVDCNTLCGCKIIPLLTVSPIVSLNPEQVKNCNIK